MTFTLKCTGYGRFIHGTVYMYVTMAVVWHIPVQQKLGAKWQHSTLGERMRTHLISSNDLVHLMGDYHTKHVRNDKKQKFLW